MKRLRYSVGMVVLALAAATASAQNGTGDVTGFEQYNGYVLFSGWACTLLDFSPVNPNKHIRIVQDSTGFEYWNSSMVGTYDPGSPQCTGYPDYLNNGWGWYTTGNWEPGNYSFYYEETLDRTWIHIGTRWLQADPCSPVCP